MGVILVFLSCRAVSFPWSNRCESACNREVLYQVGGAYYGLRDSSASGRASPALGPAPSVGRMVTYTRPQTPQDGCSDSSRGDHRVGQSTVPQGDHRSPCSFSELETSKGRWGKYVGWHSDSQVGSRKSDIRWYKDTTLPDTDHQRQSHSIFTSLSVLLTTSRRKLQLGANISLTLL